VAELAIDLNMGDVPSPLFLVGVPGTACASYRVCNAGFIGNLIIVYYWLVVM
jgi:hypothetical protein